nr:GGDEF domain-containing protein [Longibaculum muris]
MFLAFADILKSQFREDDILGRYGGDEFEIFARGLTDKQVLLEKLETLMKKLNEIHIQDISLKCSIGATIVKEDMLYADIFNQSDEALYEAKKIGKNQYIIKE